MRCSYCDGLLRAMDSRTVERDGKTYRIINLYCLKPGCTGNNGKPVHTKEVEVTNNGND